MARLDLSPSVRGYLELHAVDPELAFKLGIRSKGDAISYPYTSPRGETYVRTRDLNDENKRTMQPKGEPLILWWPAGRPEPGAEVLLTEGEPDALAALSALNGYPATVAALPGTEVPEHRITAELAQAERVYVAMDGDHAGKKAFDKIARALQTYTELRVLLVGNGEDLASRLYREDDREGWLRTALGQAKPAPKLRLKAEPGGYRRKAADRTRDLLARGIDPDRLELGELLDVVVDYVTKYVVLPVIEKGEERYERAVVDLLALWVLHTHSFPAWWATPYLRIVSAAPESAKSLLMEVLSDVARRSWLAVSPSPAVLYRYIDRHTPALFLDEMDNFGWDERRDALAVLNNGYRPGFKVARCNEKGDLEEFQCYCPKAFAGLDEKQMPPALLSRSITIRMEPKHAAEPVENYIAPDAGPRAAEIRDRCQAWAERHIDELKGHRPDLVGLTNRRAEVWWPLLVLGEHAGGEWQDRARGAARVLGTGGDETDRLPQQVLLLADIRNAFGEDDAAIFSRELRDHLNSLIESPWGDRHRGDGISARDLASMLRPFKVRPKKIRIGEEIRQGFNFDQFEDAFARYLPPLPESGTSGTSGTTAPHSHADVPDVPDVPDTAGDGEDGVLFDDIDPDPVAPAPGDEGD